MTRPQRRERVELRLVGHPVFAAKAPRLQGCEHPQDFLAAPAHAQAVHNLVLNQSVGIDQEQSPHRDLLPLLVNPVGLRHRTIHVAGQREIQASESSPCYRSRHPALVQIHGVTAHAQDLALMLLELLVTLAQANQLGGTNQGKIARVE